MTTPHTRGRVPPDYTANVQAEIGRTEMTHREVARRAGIAWSTWQRRVSGESEWTARNLDRVAHVLGIDVAVLYRRST